MGIIGLFLLITFAIALAIASATGRGGTRSFGRFIAVLVVAWILVAMAGALLVFGACALIFGRMFPGGGCINC
jgi:hypothetical protein